MTRGTVLRASLVIALVFVSLLTILTVIGMLVPIHTKILPTAPY